MLNKTAVCPVIFLFYTSVCNSRGKSLGVLISPPLKTPDIQKIGQSIDLLLGGLNTIVRISDVEYPYNM